MHKCPNCGQEFESKFCPNCGAQWQEEKTCPKCGAKISGSSRFCNECGYSFTGTKIATVPKEKKPSQIKQKLCAMVAWAKSHLKIVVPVALGLVVLIILLSLIPTFIALKTNGTYYKYRGGKFDEETYFTLSGGKWTDEDGEKGTYKIDGENIVFYVELFGTTEELASGTISNGVLSLGTGGASKDIYVKKDHKHEYGEWKTVREADCTTDGLKTRTCACGDTERDETPLLGHTGDWTILKEATCTEEGSREVHCTRCNKDVTEVIEKLPHIISGDWQYDTDKHWKVCSVCNSNVEADHSNKFGCSICGYPLTYEKYYNNYKVSGIIPTYTKTEIEIPTTYDNLPVNSIGDMAFRDCSSLTSITIPDGVTSIGNFAFGGCSSLTSINIPDSVTSIGMLAFERCSSLTSLTIPNSVTSIDSSTFSGCSSLASITVFESNPNYSSQNGILYNKAKTEIVYVPRAISGVVSIPDSVTSIGDWAFNDCSSLTSVTIPGSVTSIGSSAFGNCSSLTGVKIPDSVTSIGSSAFRDCSSLTSITIPDSVTYFGSGAFHGCTKIIQTENGVQYVGKWISECDTSVTQVTLRSDTKGIANGAFCGCSSLQSITIPDSVTLIGSIAFEDCSSLTSINFDGTIEQWTAISKGSDWNYNTGNYTVHCTDGTVAKDGTVTKN